MDRSGMSHEEKIAWQLAIVAEDAAQANAQEAASRYEAARGAEASREIIDGAAAFMARANEVWELAQARRREFPAGAPRW